MGPDVRVTSEIPSEGSYTVTMNAQGRTKDWDRTEVLEDSNWNEEGITFTFGDVVQAGAHSEPPPPPPSRDIQYETAAVTPVVQTISSDAIEGHSTFRLALRLHGDSLEHSVGTGISLEEPAVR